ncbi:hypothetical protein [Trueperella pyogenes]|uniref:hypothetical protein n=1 Tax=Trueperella pyogenes TaxID=1661 RepID=UPI00345CB697
MKINKLLITSVCSLGLLFSVPVSAYADTGTGATDSFHATTYEAIKQEDGSALVTINNGYLDNQNGKIVVSNNQGHVLEILPQSLTSPTHEVLNFTYSITDKNQVRVEVNKDFSSSIATNSLAAKIYSRSSMMLSRSSWGDYFKCVGKNIAGGFVGGAAAGCLGGYLAPAPAVCGTGAGVGAATGAVGTGVGSLFWCW